MTLNFLRSSVKLHRTAFQSALHCLLIDDSLPALLWISAENYMMAHKILNNLLCDFSVYSTGKKHQTSRATALVIGNESSVQHNIFMPVKVFGKDFHLY